MEGAPNAIRPGNHPVEPAEPPRQGRQATSDAFRDVASSFLGARFKTARSCGKSVHRARLVALDFQRLSGEDRANPHRLVLRAIAERLGETPPDGARWADDLRWLQGLDAALGDRSVLAVIDEVERVEDGIRAGWCSTDFLDFVRAAGDSLRKIRILMLSAHPPRRLGPHWSDRLISVTTRRLGYLDEGAPRELVVRPIEGFPDIYPDGGVDRILRETRCHPFLIQKVCDELCHLLNQSGGLRKATDDDLTQAFDRAANGIELFDELWSKLLPAEQAALHRLVTAPDTATVEPAMRELIREEYVEIRDGKPRVAVPMFAEWIAEGAVVSAAGGGGAATE